MNGYLFIAGITQSQIRPTPGRGGQMTNTIQVWDGCASAILYGGDPEQAQKRFETWCQPPAEGDPTATVVIKKVVAAQLVDQLLTEAGGQPLDWTRIAQQVNDLRQTTPVDDFEPGYWVDPNQALPPGTIRFDIEALKRDVPEDLRSGLNWSPDKQFYFLISVLSQRPLFPAEDGLDLDGFVAALPELRDKEAAVLVMARNAVVAAWLWRKYAADTRLAAHEIKIDPCCSFIPAE